MEAQQIIKTLSYLIYGGQQQLEKHLQLKEIIDLIPELHDQPEYYSMTIEDKIKYQTQQLLQVVKLIKQGIIKAEDIHLLYDLLPESTQPLEIHTNVFLPYFKYLIMKNDKKPQQAQALKLVKEFVSYSQIGSVLMGEFHTQSYFKATHVKDITTELTYDRRSCSYILNTKENVVKYCANFSYVSNYAIVLAKFSKENGITVVVPVLVQIRDKNLKPVQGVNIKYLGRSVHDSYKVGVAFQNYQIPEDQIISTIHLESQEYIALFNFLLKGEIAQLSHSCKDLLKAVYLSIKYTQMRTQFKDTKDQKEEKPIIDFQVVNQRITNALSIGIIYSVVLNRYLSSYLMLRDNIKDRKLAMSIVFFKGFRGRAEEKILEQIETIRECCGGFGFQRFSGFPNLYERVTTRITCNNNYKKDIIEMALTYLGKQTISFLDEQHMLLELDTEKYRVHYFNIAMNEPTLKKRLQEYQNFSEKQISDDIALLKVTQCSIIQKKLLCEKIFLENERNVIKSQRQLLELGYELADCFCLSKFYEVHFFKLYRLASKAMNLVYVRFYMEKLMDNFQIMNELNSQLSRSQLYNLFLKKKNSCEEEIKQLYPTYLQSFQFDGIFKNVIVGREDQEDFYLQLKDWSKNRNNRNNPELVAEIQNEILPLLTAKPNL
ncbi:acyl-coenzyme A oxidase, putative (macronuclear) [Tetrahymena thermophila SB210]|uniref:Acyl-coenzyme A oxidase, putative n=1 Tax=Tetrahymena thermophila (strain SB210) TaxID=312017 RepID=Q23K78_TETTS|nr:acyl-coenzyme A oxidase, putative [Tetrahymena thermophila SB210]EAR96965.3 acyl-coenzyme A oxidase, putative [Tetrahymena thermophila SB210]|eukprot:XP_001017210.3 acyl-coenzyme A oxidase, putative [Tetrahymena thermophila SB210]